MNMVTCTFFLWWRLTVGEFESATLEKSHGAFVHTLDVCVNYLHVLFHRSSIGNVWSQTF